MQKKRLILAAAIMSMSLIVFMSMNGGRAAADMFANSGASPEQMFFLNAGQHDSSVDSIAMFEQ